MRMNPTDVMDVLNECWEFLDNYVDVNDGDDGRPVPNRAMALQQRVQEAHDAIQRAQERQANDH